MMPFKPFIAAVLAFLVTTTTGFAPSTRINNVVKIRSTSIQMTNNPKGCAARPFDKKKIAVFGAGGYLGATVFGFLQRAASLYGTGIAGGSSPRAVGATRSTSEALNKELTTSFSLAYAGEDLIRLVDTTNVDHIKERVKSFDAAVLGTVYQLERRAVTLNTYEKTPNDKTYDFYLDERYGAREDDVPADDADIHLDIFRNMVKACKESGSVQHLVVLETPKTARPMDFVNILDEEGIAYTYLRVKNAMKKDVYFTFDKGIKDNLEVVSVPVGSSLESIDASKSGSDCVVYREDVAALIVQSLMSLDWSKSRILEASASSTPVDFVPPGKKAKFDKEWCTNSKLIGEKLINIA
mmetsp:Transcript_9098/g.19429  ORF Transcript_9098/g.19429 Transcript_9098/m.19429 type:complete len:353 (+) Transcript_9098:144-1202(+)